ncbi:MAG: ABC transporter ATP-binding protein [Bifidobacteriaceae bacterium]|jgi:peptide/nickel transport system ATP-binding protein|nr:ABC transporter ATP-binding protein [Bifidobacteriaceae bacterium]
MTEQRERPLLEVADLSVEYRLAGRRRGRLKAVSGVSFAVAPGRTVGLVGESGSGKSTIGNAVLGLVPSAGGTITFDGTDITKAKRAERKLLARRLQVVFQDPYGSMNRSITVGDTVAEALRHNLGLPATDARAKARRALADVGLPPEAAERYPTEFSGGQRQRIAIARALVMNPEFVVCDEAVSALDLSVQAQVLNLLMRLRDERGLSYLFITHDLAVVRYVSDEIVVLYGGQVMERGPAALVASQPVHPYTRALVDAAPVPDPEAQAQRRRARAQMAAATESIPGIGCPFAPRCPEVMDVCRTTRPALRAREGVEAACHLAPAVGTGGAIAARPEPGGCAQGEPTASETEDGKTAVPGSPGAGGS